MFPNLYKKIAGCQRSPYPTRMLIKIKISPPLDRRSPQSYKPFVSSWLRIPALCKASMLLSVNLRPRRHNHRLTVSPVIGYYLHRPQQQLAASLAGLFKGPARNRHSPRHARGLKPTITSSFRLLQMIKSYSIPPKYQHPPWIPPRRSFIVGNDKFDRTQRTNSSRTATIWWGNC